MAEPNVPTPPSEASLVTQSLDELALELLDSYSYDAKYPTPDYDYHTSKPRKELSTLLVTQQCLLLRRPCIMKNGVNILQTIQEENEQR